MKTKIIRALTAWPLSLGTMKTLRLLQMIGELLPSEACPFTLRLIAEIYRTAVPPTKADALACAMVSAPAARSFQKT